MENDDLSFACLVNTVASIHERLAERAVNSINISLTLRNWLIGCYIREYELKGSDRAKYGEKLMDELADALLRQGLKRCSRRELYRYRQFYLRYPQIRESLSPQLLRSFSFPKMFTDQIVESPTPQLKGVPRIRSDILLNNLSFTHLNELMQINDDLKRVFYETECVRSNWSVRELKRQIASLYFERSGLSRNKEKLAELAHSTSEHTEPRQIIRDPYVFEFLGLKTREVMGESDLEDSLLDKLQEFLLELGHGFCFEARQKRILIGNEYFFVDLVFYHRILKCHVLIELKVDAFRHEFLGQLNTYLNWYGVNENSPDDNPPIGILLCTKKNHALVRYALAGMDNQLFVSKYQLELPGKEEIKLFIEEQMKEIGGGEDT